MKTRPLLAICVLCLLVASMFLPGSPRARAQNGDVWMVVDTPQYVLDDQGLRVPGYPVTRTPGAPQLPFWTTVVEIPAGADWSLMEVGAKEQLLEGQDPLPPAPGPEMQPEPPDYDGNGATTDVLRLEGRPDPEIYGRDALYPSQAVQAGPEAIARGKRLLPIKVYPFQYNPVSNALRYRPRIEFALHFSYAPHASLSAPGVEAPSPVGNASVPGLLVRTAERGLYRLTSGALGAAGVPVGALDPAELVMWYLGEPVDVDVLGGEDGRFDPGDSVVFYAQPYAGRYMEENVYRLTWSGTPGPRVRTRSGAPARARPPVTTVRRRTRIEYDRVYYSTYSDLPRDADHFFDNPLYANEAAPSAAVTYTLALEDLAPGEDAEIRIALHGGQELANRSPDQSLLLRLNGVALGPYQWDGSVEGVITQLVPAASVPRSMNSLSLEASLDQLPGIGAYWVSPDWAEIVYGTKAVATYDRYYVESVGQGTGDATAALPPPMAVTPGRLPQAPAAAPKVYLPVLLQLSSATGPDLAVDGFGAGAIRVYDVSDARRPVRLTEVTINGNDGRYTAIFAANGVTSYYLASESALLAPASLQLDAASSLRTPDHTADYIAIVHRSLWDAVQPLLDHRAAEGLRVAKVNVQDIYDEFSGSRVDPEAIRAFLSYAYRNWNGGAAPPQYVLLVGDGHYDYRGALRPGLPNLIPPYLLSVDPYIGETAADNRFVSVDGEGDFLPDMAIGRIPAKSPADVAASVDKILAYEKSGASAISQKPAVFVADTNDDPNYDFHGLSDRSRAVLPSTYSTATVYYKSGTALDSPTEMRGAIKDVFDGGPPYLQWFGHAAPAFWSRELSSRVWQVADVPGLDPNTTWPFTADFSCWSGYFVNVVKTGDERVLAEAMLLTPQRGSIASFAPSGKHLGESLATLNEALVHALFVERVERVGLAVDAARIAYFAATGGPSDLIDTQILFGDPATRLRLR